MALVAHMASVQHKANDTIGGEAMPRSMAPTNVVLGLTNVMLMSATLWSCVACCVRDCGGYMVWRMLAPSSLLAGSAASREWATYDVSLNDVADGKAVRYHGRAQNWLWMTYCCGASSGLRSKRGNHHGSSVSMVGVSRWTVVTCMRRK